MTFYLRALAGSLLPPHGAVREGSVTVGASRQGVLEASLKAREEAQWGGCGKEGWYGVCSDAERAEHETEWRIWLMAGRIRRRIDEGIAV